MGTIISSKPDRDVLMSRLGSWLAEERYGVALLALDEFLKAEPQDRECRLLWLLCHIKIHGIQAYEHEIEKVRSFSNLDCREKAVIKRILLIAVQQAKLERREDQVLYYQRLIRRLVRGSPLSTSCSIAEKVLELRYRTHGRIRRILTSTRSVPVPRWRFAALLTLVLVSIFVVYKNKESPTKELPPEIPANRPIAGDTRLPDGRGPGSRESPAAMKEVERASNPEKSRPGQPAIERDTAITPPSSSTKEAKFRGGPTARGKGNSSRAEKGNRTRTQNSSPRKRDASRTANVP